MMYLSHADVGANASPSLTDLQHTPCIVNPFIEKGEHITPACITSLLPCLLSVGSSWGEDGYIRVAITNDRYGMCGMYGQSYQVQPVFVEGYNTIYCELGFRQCGRSVERVGGHGVRG